jgi:outer membrane protein assembly factor BamB
LRQEALVCWRVDTGKEAWRHADQPAQAFAYGGPRSTPTVAEGRLYASGSAGLMFCCRADSGKLLWQRDLRAELGARPPQWGFAYSPLVEDGLVFVCPGGRAGKALAALDAKTGETVWTALDDPPGYSSPVAVTVGGVRQIIFFTGTRLVGLTPGEGKLLWQYPWRTEHDVNAATPLPFRARAGGRVQHYVFISSGYGKGCAVVKIEPEADGFRARGVYESNELCCHFASPVRHGNYLYGLDETRGLTCLDLRTGEVCWRQKGFQKGSLLRNGATLLILGENGRLALAEANPDEYRELARAQPLSGRCWTLPALAEGRLFLRNQSHVLCLDVRPKRAEASRER